MSRFARKWTKTVCTIEASKYRTKKEFKLNCYGAYNAAFKNGWLKEICSHMIHASIKWNNKTIIELALKYDSLYDFRINEVNAYDAASKRLNMIPELRFLLGIKKKENKIWNKENCYKEALKYSSRKQFILNNQSAYQAARKNKWLDEICSHMNKLHNNWTKEECYQIALKYQTKIEFIYNDNKFYQYAKKYGWLNEICTHMIININQYNYPRIIYAYIFSDNSIYIGLTKNFKIRHKFRKNYLKDTVTKYINKTQLQPKIKFLTEFIPAIEAQKMEEYYINYYKKLGYNILNKTKAGSLGGPGIKIVEHL